MRRRSKKVRRRSLLERLRSDLMLAKMPNLRLTPTRTRSTLIKIKTKTRRITCRSSSTASCPGFLA